eukprot:SAG31_NODE_18186_length_644_cov_0.943119_1_plen_38_part_10
MCDCADGNVPCRANASNYNKTGIAAAVDAAQAADIVVA